MTRIGTLFMRELREALPSFLFFLVAFHMIAITKTVILEDYDLSATGSAIATMAALIVSKAILLVEKLPVSRLFSDRQIGNVLWKSLLFGAVAMLFRILEELAHALARPGSLIAGAEQLVSAFSWPHFLIIQMWLFALLVLFCLASSFVHAMGTDKAWRMLFHQERGSTH